MIGYEIIGLLVRIISSSFRDVRYYRKLNKYKRILETGNRTAMRLASNLVKPKPLRTIARTFNNFSKNQQADDEDDDEETSSISSKKKL